MGHVLKTLKEQTEEMCKIAVQENGLALQYVHEKNKTEEICKLAVQQNQNALQYVPNKNKTEQSCYQDCFEYPYKKWLADQRQKFYSKII